MNAPLIVENSEERTLHCYTQYRYYSVSIEQNELDGMIGILRIWITDDDWHTFLIDPDRCTPRCKTPDKFWEVLKHMATTNRFTVHAEP
jgi:hypothetical protein